ncbi:MAG: hypothetical protein WBK77_05780 [Alphaproteobacteria bacterium]
MRTHKTNNPVIPGSERNASVNGDPAHKCRKAAYNILYRMPAFAGMTIALFSFYAHAQDAAPTPVTYSPPPCEFSVTFPSAPYTTRRCDEIETEKCYDQTSYTQVYDMASTVNFRVICNPIDEGVYDHYSDQVMEATLKAMTKHSVVKTFDASFRTKDGYKQAGLVGEGKTGTLPTLYIAQLWIGKKSALSVEAELIGEPEQKADELFRDIIKSVHYVNDKQPPEKESKADKKEEKPEEQKEEKKE